MPDVESIIQMTALVLVVTITGGAGMTILLCCNLFDNLLDNVLSWCDTMREKYDRMMGN